jgi:hypothetical protein
MRLPLREPEAEEACEGKWVCDWRGEGAMADERCDEDEALRRKDVETGSGMEGSDTGEGEGKGSDDS